MTNLIPWIFLVPFFGFLISGTLGRKMPATVVGGISSLAVLISFVMTLVLFMQIDHDPTPIKYYWYNWLTLGEISLDIGFLVDRLSVWMMMIITGIGFLIHVYSIGYMQKDAGVGRFFSYLNLFIFFMLLLVMGDSYLTLFAGWEGVGLCSYLLIGFWYKNTHFGYAGRKAFVMNRIGDLAFLLGMYLIWQYTGSLEFNTVFEKIGGIAPGILTAIALLLFIGATGKSAQLPLFTWLPDAMAGPTPVSALIHAATMVTAGIYMVVRSNVIYLNSEVASQFILIVAVLTSLIAGMIALQQNDIKKVLAYSTVSQLGLMFVALGVGAYTAAFFHLTTHAFFKALLFLGSGSVIHAMGGEQDIRRMGGLRKFLPQTNLTFLLGSLAIIGFPLLAGFFSKDEILAASFDYGPIVWVFGVLISVFTAAYMFRMYFLTFYGEFRGTADQKHHLHESPASMTLPLWILAILSVIGGLINIPALFGGGQFLHHWLDPVLKGEEHVMGLSHSTEWTLMIVTTVIILSVLFWAYRTFVSGRQVPVEDDKLRGWKTVLANKFYIDDFYDNAVAGPVMDSSRIADRNVEKGLIDRIAEGIGAGVKALADTLRRTQDGNLEKYLLGMVIGAIVLLVFGYMF
jgi:NADH-quinone oxidoreductase subunit L